MGQQLTSFDGATATHSAMKFLALSVILALAVTLSSGFSVEHALHQEWSLFKITHGKTYAAAEEELRMTIYLQNRDMIAAHNARFEKGEVSYSMKMNQFGDMPPEEFEAMQNYKPHPVSIGATRDSSPVLKIKDNAEAAGRSLPLVLWKDNISVKPAN